MTRIKDEKAELEGVLAVAKAMSVAARTAPKGRGEDAIETLIVFGGDLQSLADAMVQHGKGSAIHQAFKRDAENVRKSQAALLIGLRDLKPKRMKKPLNCGACGHESCIDFLGVPEVEGYDFAGPFCLFQAIDLGIALSSASSVAARFHVDNRIMYTVGGPTRKLGWMGCKIIIGIPLSCTGKNIYFDRG